MRISLEQALNILMDHVTHGKTERKTLEDCLGLVLSEDVYALLDITVPSWKYWKMVGK